MEASGAQFFPDLLNGIHFRRVRMNEYEFNIRECFQRSGFVPRSAIADENNVVVRIRRRQMLQKDVHAYRIAARHDKKARFAG